MGTAGPGRKISPGCVSLAPALNLAPSVLAGRSGTFPWNSRKDAQGIRGPDGLSSPQSQERREAGSLCAELILGETDWFLGGHISPRGRRKGSHNGPGQVPCLPGSKRMGQCYGGWCYQNGDEADRLRMLSCSRYHFPILQTMKLRFGEIR